MSLSDKELYEYAEKMLSFEKDDVIDEVGLEAFAKEIKLVLTPAEQAAILNLANEIKYANKKGTDDEEVAYESITSSEDASTEESIPF